MKIPKALIFMIGCIAGLHEAKAQADTASKKKSFDTTTVYNLKEVEIKADDLYDRKNSTLPKLIIEGRDYEKFEFSTVGEVLRTLPGMVFDKGNESKDVKFRGLDKEYTQVLIDGERIPDGGEKREFQVDRIPMNMVERIEIIRSPMANLDAQGIAGTINIILKKPKYNKFSSFNHSFGKIEKHGYSGDLYFNYGDRINDKINFVLNGGVQTRTLPKIHTVQTYDSTDFLLSKIEEEELKKYIESNYAPRLNYNPNKKHTFSFDPLIIYSQENRHKDKKTYTPKPKTGEFNIAPEEEKELKNRLGWALRLTYTWKPNDKWILNYRPIYQVSIEDKDKSVVGRTSTGIVNKRDEETEIKTDKEIINRIFGTYKYASWSTLGFGIENGVKERKKEKEKFISGISSPVGPKDFYILNENRMNYYLMDEINLIDKHFITPGIRFESTVTKSTSRTIITIPKKDTVFTTIQNAFENWNPSLHYLWKTKYNMNIHLTLAKTVRRPKFDDLIPYTETKGGTLLNPDVKGNPELKPEIAWGYEGGVDKFFEHKQFKGFFGVNGFYRDITDKMENIIEQNSNNRYNLQVQNVGNAIAWGFEFDGKFTINMKKAGLFSIKGNFSRLYSELTDAITGQLRKLKGQPDYVYNIGFDYSSYKDFVTVGANFNFISDIDESERKPDGKYEVKDNSPVQRLDFFIGFSFNQKFAIRLSGQNLLNIDKAIYKKTYLSTGMLEKKEYQTEKFYQTYLISLQLNF
jgi:outer membrane receptor for ferrienterochelin and colicin